MLFVVVLIIASSASELKKRAGLRAELESAPSKRIATVEDGLVTVEGTVGPAVTSPLAAPLGRCPVVWYSLWIAYEWSDGHTSSKLFEQTHGVEFWLADGSGVLARVSPGADRRSYVDSSAIARPAFTYNPLTPPDPAGAPVVEFLRTRGILFDDPKRLSWDEQTIAPGDSLTVTGWARNQAAGEGTRNPHGVRELVVSADVMAPTSVEQAASASRPRTRNGGPWG